MNYRHAYHAGNFADVVKHSLLTLIIGHLRQKDSAFCVVDTHAGIGRYDLKADEAGKTGEFRQGIGRLLAGGVLPPLLDGYVAAVRAVNPAWPSLDYYPGSPLIARSLLRPDDRLAAVELHPEDARRLKAEFAGDRQVGVHLADGFQALKALLPPKERRGVVLIDPPFEATDEIHRIVHGLGAALRRWPTGIYAIWYPIKTSAPVDRFRGEMAAFGRPCLTAEVLLGPAGAGERLSGSGMAVINPPWRLDEALAELLPILGDRLAAAGGTRLTWLIRP
jgi:23S rRNA (adenine2030-N6)-methyltransferase